MNKTATQYDAIIKISKDIFTKKLHDYGAAWRILRTSSVTDQIFIKAQRIRSLEEKKTSKVDEGITSEYLGILNYSIIGLIQIELGFVDKPDIGNEEAIKLFDKFAIAAKSLMENKNHDYSEAWREMRIQSLTDIILVKLLRIKQIEDNDGQTVISEGIDANFFDIINYAVFALIKLEEQQLFNKI